jgi:hypothetical protein
VGQPLSRQRIGADKGHKHVYQSPAGSVKNGVPVSHGNTGVLENRYIALNSRFYREQYHLPRGNCKGRRKRCGDYKNHGIQNYQKKYYRKKVNKEIIDLVL